MFRGILLESSTLGFFEAYSRLGHSQAYLKTIGFVVVVIAVGIEVADAVYVVDVDGVRMHR